MSKNRERRRERRFSIKIYRQKGHFHHSFQQSSFTVFLNSGLARGGYFYLCITIAVNIVEKGEYSRKWSKNQLFVVRESNCSIVLLHSHYRVIQEKQGR